MNGTSSTATSRTPVPRHCVRRPTRRVRPGWTAGRRRGRRRLPGRDAVGQVSHHADDADHQVGEQADLDDTEGVQREVVGSPVTDDQHHEPRRRARTARRGLSAGGSSSDLSGPGHAQRSPSRRSWPGRPCPGRPWSRGLRAPVADHQRDRRLPRLDGLRRLPQRSVQDRAGRDPGEDALRLEELTHPAYGVTRADGEARVDQGLVVQLGDEALVEVAQPVDELAVAGLAATILTSGLCARKKRLTPIRVPVVPRPPTKWVTSGRSARISGRCPPRGSGRSPRCRTGRHHPVGVLLATCSDRVRPRSSRPPPVRRRSPRPTSAAAGGAPGGFSGITQTRR